MDETAARQAFEDALRDYAPGFGTFFLARLFGLEITYEDETCRVDFPARDFMFNPQGSLHGGAIATAMDISMGHLIHHTIGRAAITLEMKTQYLRGVPAGPARAVGRFLKQGRSVSYLESRLTGADGKLAAVATSTWQMPRE